MNPAEFIPISFDSLFSLNNRTSLSDLSDLLLKLKARAADDAGTSKAGGSTTEAIEDRIESLSQYLSGENFLLAKSIEEAIALVYLKYSKGWTGRAVLAGADNNADVIREMQAMMRDFSIEHGVFYKGPPIGASLMSAAEIDLMIGVNSPSLDLNVTVPSPVPTIPPSPARGGFNLNAIPGSRLAPDYISSDTFDLSSLVQLPPEGNHTEVTSGRILSPLPQMEDVLEGGTDLLQRRNTSDE